MRLYILLCCVIYVFGCSRVPKIPVDSEFQTPLSPDYSNPAHWAALPFKEDPSDRLPSGISKEEEIISEVDVFFVHPTIYRNTRAGNDLWNADVNDEKLNKRVDESAILHQASVFNGAGRVFAPRYRQANLNVYYAKGRSVAEQALDTAYTDVKAAFRYYLDNYNQGRPIILASHSQGTTHSKRLLYDFFERKPLRKQLIAAYLIGMAVSKDAYSTIPVCESASETSCFVSWRTYRQDFTPQKNYKDTVPNIAVVNPLSWTTRSGIAPDTLNLGSVLHNFSAKPKKGLVWAEVRGAALYTNRPNFFGDILFTRRNYHIVDYNLFWLNIRQNAILRAKSFLKNEGQKS